jgi:nitroreductase
MKTIEKKKKTSAKAVSMTILDAIRNRRAIRHYTDQPVDAETVKVLLEYAVQAPSAVNGQSWSFVVIQNRHLMEEISFKAKKILENDPRWKSEALQAKNQILDPAFNIFYQASTLIIVCANREETYPEIDCYLACENLMLAAFGLGLGTCPIGLASEILQTAEMKRMLKIPEGHYPVLPIILGYPSKEEPRTPRNAPRILNWIPA